jgi:hypothetical protein
MSKKINENDKNFKFQNPLTCMYLTQPIFRENLNFDTFCKKRLFQIKTTITFAYRLKKSVIYEKLSTKKVAQFLASQNSKGKYESRKILGFVKKLEN